MNNIGKINPKIMIVTITIVTGSADRLINIHGSINAMAIVGIKTIIKN